MAQPDDKELARQVEIAAEILQGAVNRARHEGLRVKLRLSELSVDSALTINTDISREILGS